MSAAVTSRKTVEGFSAKRREFRTLPSGKPISYDWDLKVDYYDPDAGETVIIGSTHLPTEDLRERVIALLEALE